MNTSISGAVSQLVSAFKKLSKGAKIAIFSFLGVSVAIAIILTAVLNSSKYTVLYRGLSSAESLEILRLLDDMGVDTKVESDGSILVSKDKAPAIKMQLATEGYPNSTLSYDLFLEKSDLLTTDYEQRKLYIFQLQDRLQESIETLQGVKSAIVTLGIPEENPYVLKSEKADITASVALQLYSNAQLTPKQIRGIVLLVARSIPGLAEENVVVVGEDGQQLNAGPGFDSADIGSKIETISELSKIFEEKIKSFLEPVFGKDGLSVSVNVVVDFNRTTSEETSYAPVIGDSGIISWVERHSESSGDTGSQDEVPTYSEAEDPGDGGGTETSSSYSAQYLVNQLIKQIYDDGGNITDMTVAVIINAADMSDEEMAKYRELVAFSAGVPVENVALTYSRFLGRDTVYPIPVTEDEEPDAVFGIIDRKMLIIIGMSGLGLLLLIVAITIIVKAIKNKNKKKKQQLAEIEKEIKVQEEKKDMPGEIVLNETREQALKRQITEFASVNAETVAQLLRVWIKEDEGR